VTDIAALTVLNAGRWAHMSVNRESLAEVDAVAHRLTTPPIKTHCLSVSRQTGVPWWVVAVILEREAGGSLAANLAQGDPWNEVSTHVPAGRGPFKSFEAAACDALTNCAPHAAEWEDWSPGGTLTLLEEYNGLAYANHGVPSPYVWSGTDQYTIGKIVVDHGPIEQIVDKQLGCAALLSRMQAIDSSVVIGQRLPMPTSTKAGGAAVAGGGAATAAHAAGLPIWAIVVVGVGVAAATFAAIHFSQANK
jgi:lysozyme family protein